jgi:hypothetical protein
VKGVIGLAAACLLIQAHVPALIPRRSFGNTPLFLDGFPRDENEHGKNTIVDTLMFVITKSFQASPTAFKGASADLIRGVINEKSSVRKQAITLIGKILERSPSLQNALKDVKLQRELAPIVHEKPNVLIPTIQPPKQLGTIKGYVSCGTLRPFWTGLKLPRYFQKKVQIKDRVPLTTAASILPAKSLRVLPIKADEKEVRQNIKKGIPKDIKLNVGDDWRVNVRLATRLANIFQIPVLELSSIDPLEKQDTLRDIVKSYLYRIVHLVHDSPEMKRRLEDVKKKDIALYVLLADVSEEEKTTNTLRAMERVTFIERLRQKRDDDRAVMQELLAQGQAPYVMTNLDRAMFATQLYAQKERDEFEEMAAQLNNEIGVGLPRDLNEEHAVGMPENVDNGDYGDYMLYPNRDGRDPFDQEFDNEEMI